jgi:hypothetical protein
VAVWIRVPRLYVLPQRWPLVRFDPNLLLSLGSRSLLGSTKPAGQLVRNAAANHGPLSPVRIDRWSAACGQRHASCANISRPRAHRSQTVPLLTQQLDERLDIWAITALTSLYRVTLAIPGRL